MRSTAWLVLSATACGPVESSPGTDTDSTAPSPSPSADLVRYLTGDAVDAALASTGPSLLLMGGGADVDAAFAAWLPGGDVVVLRASGADGYNDYLYADLGGIDSMETLIVDSRVLADDVYVRWTLDHAEAIFIAGGDQADYFAYWQGTEVSEALAAAWQRGAAIGGTSAGLAVLGAYAFTAANGTVYSEEALADPYNEYITFGSLVALPPLANTITDSHFRERDRMGRLVAFVARLVQDDLLSDAYGLGIDEATAVVVWPNGEGRVFGAGGAYVVAGSGRATACAAGTPLVYSDLPLRRWTAGQSLTLPLEAAILGSASTVSAQAGALVPADPY